MQEIQSNHLLPSPLSRRVSKLGLGTEFRSEKISRRNGFRYSAEESTHSEAFRVPRKSQFRSSERNGMKFRGKNYFYETAEK
jgi:hypothetical protein